MVKAHFMRERRVHGLVVGYTSLSGCELQAIMRVGLNLLYLLPGTVGGTETYASGLLRSLAQIDQEDEFIVFMNEESANWMLPDVPNFVRVDCPLSAVSRIKRYFFEQFRLPQMLKKYGAELVHSLGYVSPLFTPCPFVVTIPDLNFRAFGKHIPRRRRLSLEFFVRQSARRAKRVITISEFAQREISQSYNLPAGQVVVTHLAPHPRETSTINGQDARDAVFLRLKIRSPYVLAFSNGFPHKNISRLVAAFTQAKEKHDLPHQLVLVGHRPSNGTFSSQAPMVGNGDVQFTNYLDGATLETVLRGAQMLVFPSLYEGFGLPVLEAMRAGVPVVCSDKASLPEVAGAAAVFFDPYSVKDMSEKIALLALDSALREKLKQKGYENLKRFSWERTARETLAVYEQVYAASKASGR